MLPRFRPEADGGAGDSGGDPQDQPTQDAAQQPDQQLGDAGKKALDAERDRAKKAERELSRLQKQFEALGDPESAKAKLAEYDKLAEANKTEAERQQERFAAMQKDVADRDARIADLERSVADGQVERDFMAAALGEGAVNARAAYTLAKDEGLVGEYADGKVGKHDLKALRERHPYLFRPLPPKSQGRGDVGAGAGAPVRAEAAPGFGELQQAYAEIERAGGR